jgi:hypothetical protein
MKVAITLISWILERPLAAVLITALWATACSYIHPYLRTLAEGRAKERLLREKKSKAKNLRKQK